MERFYGKLMNAETYVAAFGFTACCMVIFVSAIMRGIGHPLNWAWDISLFLFAWSVFLAADSAMRHDKLVNVDLIVSRLPERWRIATAVASYALIIAFLAALLVFGSILSYTTRARMFQGTPGFSYTWVTLSVPVGAALQIVTVARKLVAFGRPAPAAAGDPTAGGAREGGDR